MTNIPSVEEVLTENLIELIMQDIKWHEEATAPSQFIEAMSPDKAFIAGLTQAVFLIEKAHKILSIEETSRHFCNGIALQLKTSNAAMEVIRLLNKELPKALTAEREAGRKEKRNLYQGLQLMFEQYCPNGNHEFMTAGEDAETLLEQFSYLRCSCDNSPEHQEFDGHTRYCEALNPPTSV